MPRHEQIPDLVHDSKIETSVSGTRIEHVFYEPGPTPQERQSRRVECWERDVILGKGAFGIVYKERRCSQGGAAHALRAVKQISKSMVNGEPLEYLRELEAIIKFSHRNYSHCFVRSDGWYELGDSIYITMEYIEHGDLQRYLGRPVPESEVRQITGQVLEGLHFMHDNGFVHRDLKPGNIMVVGKGPDWFVKIADFGISKRRQKGVTTLHTLQRGTLGFVAPEVLGVNSGGAGGSYTFAVDIWSLGAVAYYILTNKLVFDNAGDIVMYAMGMCEFPIAALEENNASDKAKSFIMSLLAIKPESRPLVAATIAHPWLADPLTMRPQTLSTRNQESLSETPITCFSKASGTWTSYQDSKGDQSDDLLDSQGTETSAKADTTTNDNNNVQDDSDGSHGTGVNHGCETQIYQLKIPKDTPSTRNYAPPSVEDITDHSASNHLPPLPLDYEFVLEEDQEFAESEKTESESWGEEKSMSTIRDVSGWGVKDLLLGNLPALKSLRDQETFWRLQEKLGTCRRLHRLTNLVNRPCDWTTKIYVVDENTYHTLEPPYTQVCFSCGRSLPNSDLAGKYGLCRHWNCLQCISWSLIHASVNPKAFPPTCCSREINWTLPRVTGVSIESGTGRLRNSLVQCAEKDCKHRFEPLYVVKDSRKGGWVVHCPNCGHTSCFECVENPHMMNQLGHKCPYAISTDIQGDAKRESRKDRHYEADDNSESAESIKPPKIRPRFYTGHGKPKARDDTASPPPIVKSNYSWVITEGYNYLRDSGFNGGQQTLFMANMNRLPDLFSQSEGLHGSSEIIHGVNFEQVNKWLDTIPRYRQVARPQNPARSLQRPKTVQRLKTARPLHYQGDTGNFPTVDAHDRNRNSASPVRYYSTGRIQRRQQLAGHHEGPRSTGNSAVEVQYWPTPSPETYLEDRYSLPTDCGQSILVPRSHHKPEYILPMPPARSSSRPTRQYSHKRVTNANHGKVIFSRPGQGLQPYLEN